MLFIIIPIIILIFSIPVLYYVYSPVIQSESPQVPVISAEQVPVISAAQVPTNITTQDECNRAGNNYLKERGFTPGRPIQAGSWSWVNPGCTVQSGGDWAIHWNSDPNGKDERYHYTTINPSYLNMGSVNTPTNITTFEECDRAGNKYLADIGKTPARPIQTGSWYWVLPKCSVQSGGDWAIHWNTDDNGKDNESIYTSVSGYYL
jgi:hypothetical protein